MILRRTICFARASSGCSALLLRAKRHSPYSIDAICIGALWGADRTPPIAMPTKNIAASITAITPSFGGGPSRRICLSKSSWSRRSIFEVPIFVCAKRNATLCKTRHNCRRSAYMRTNIGLPSSSGAFAINPKR
jgi:hypothetical protein